MNWRVVETLHQKQVYWYFFNSIWVSLSHSGSSLNISNFLPSYSSPAKVLHKCLQIIIYIPFLHLLTSHYSLHHSNLSFTHPHPPTTSMNLLQSRLLNCSGTHSKLVNLNLEMEYWHCDSSFLSPYIHLWLVPTDKTGLFQSLGSGKAYAWVKLRLAVKEYFMLM